MRKSQKVTATLGGIAVASTMAFGVGVTFAPSAQADCTGFFVKTCTNTPSNNWTTSTTWFGFGHTTVTNPGGKKPPGKN
jgi:hypothetical protein